MAKTSAERQAELRARRSGERRQVNAWLSVAAYTALKQKAERLKLTIGETLERMVTSDDSKQRIADLEDEIEGLKADLHFYKRLGKNKSLDKKDHRKLLFCLHPDQRNNATKEQLNEAFAIFQSLRLSA